MGQIEIFRIGGIPIYVDFFFVLLAILWSQPYWSSGSTQMYSAGFVLVMGLFASILLHELGHAWAARLFRVPTRAIELTGIGGICHFDRSLPASVLARTVVGLAGPAANLILWQALQMLAMQSGAAGARLPMIVMATLSSANFLLLIFNLLPAFPLDGGKVLEAWLARILGAAWSVRVVAILGFGVAAWLAALALPSNLWMLLLAGMLVMFNYQALRSVGGWRRR
jgi:Zn-dependent protease